jgi:hypothetical protein
MLVPTDFSEQLNLRAVIERAFFRGDLVRVAIRARRVDSRRSRPFFECGSALAIALTSGNAASA